MQRNLASRGRFRALFAVSEVALTAATAGATAPARDAPAAGFGAALLATGGIARPWPARPD